MEFTGITKAADVEAFQIYYYKSSPSLKKSMQNQRILFPALILALAIFLIFRQGISYLSVIYILIAVVYFIGYPKFFEFRVKQQFAKIINTTMQKHLGKYTVKFTETGITHISELGEQSFFWHSVDKAVIVKNYLFIVVGGASGLAIDCNDYSKDHIQSIIDIVHNHTLNKNK